MSESIIGVRNIFLNKRRRKLEFELYVKMYYKKDFDELKAKEDNKNNTANEIYDLICEYKSLKINKTV